MLFCPPTFSDFFWKWQSTKFAPRSSNIPLQNGRLKIYQWILWNIERRPSSASRHLFRISFHYLIQETKFVCVCVSQWNEWIPLSICVERACALVVLLNNSKCARHRPYCVLCSFLRSIFPPTSFLFSVITFYFGKWYGNDDKERRRKKHQTHIVSRSTFK